jgi:hypothetical protein
MSNPNAKQNTLPIKLILASAAVSGTLAGWLGFALQEAPTDPTINEASANSQLEQVVPTFALSEIPTLWPTPKATQVNVAESTPQPTPPVIQANLPTARPTWQPVALPPRNNIARSRSSR